MKEKGTVKISEDLVEQIQGGTVQDEFLERKCSVICSSSAP